MTNKEKEILDIIIKNPNLKQNEIADILNISRNSVAVHISSLMNQNYILGKKYIINEELLKEESKNSLFPNEYDYNINKNNKILFITNINKYIINTIIGNEIIEKVQYKSFLFDFLNYAINKNKSISEMIYIKTNIVRDNCFDIISTLNKLKIDYSLSEFTNKKLNIFYTINNQIYLKEKGEELLLSLNFEEKFDEIFVDDSLNILELENLYNKNVKISLNIDNDVSFLRKFLENTKNNSNIKNLLIRRNLLEKTLNTMDIDFLKYKFINNIKIENLYIYDDFEILFLHNDNVRNIGYDEFILNLYDNLF